MKDNLSRLITFLTNQGICDYDPRSAAQSAKIFEMVDLLLNDYPNLASLNELEQQLVECNEEIPLPLHLAVKLARSKTNVCALSESMHISFVFAVYKEHARLLPPDQHPHGENCLIRKIEQLQWLFDEIESITWSLFVVDDGCPENSGRLAKEIVETQCPNAPVQILFLEDAIAQGLPIAQQMQSAADSQKGGSVLYGMWAAAQNPHKKQIIVYTDADLSTHLGQTGLLIDGIVNKGMDAAIGSRREAASVVVKTGRRNTRGKLFIYLWKGLISPLQQITDTQCGFKAFTAETLQQILNDLIEHKFAFDIELLLKTELRRSDSICKIPIAWIDSEAASTTTGLEPYLSMLQSVAGMYRKYLPADPQTDRLADMIDSITDTEWRHLAEHIPEAIAAGEPSECGRLRPVTVDQLLRVIRS